MLRAQRQRSCAGIKDSYASAGTFAITNYMDLGSGVLILWSADAGGAAAAPLWPDGARTCRYGGVQTIDGNGMTIGELVTFQLYWNMLSTSYQVRTSCHTTAAAERSRSRSME